MNKKIFNPKELLNHLHMIHCRGQFDEIVIGDGFSAIGKNKTKTLLINHKGLTEESGMSLGLLDIQTLKNSLPKNEEEVTIIFSEEDLVVQCESTTFTFRLADPEHISTHVPTKKMEIVADHVKANNRLTLELDDHMVSEIYRIHDTIKAEQIRFTAMPKEVAFVAGTKAGHRAKFNVKVDELDDTFSVLLDAKAFVAVLKQFDISEPVSLRFTGSDSLVGVERDGYQYILSPVEE